MSLDENLIESLQPKLRSYKKYDKRGLYIEVPPRGKKRWRYKYKFKGKENRISFGTYPEVKLSDAETYMTIASDELSRGIDPSRGSKPWKKLKPAKIDYLIDIDVALKAIPESQRNMIRQLLEIHNQNIKKNRLMESLMQLAPHKELKLDFLNTVERVNANQKLAKLVADSLIDQDWFALSVIFSDPNKVSKFLIAHIAANKDYSKSRDEISSQKMTLSEFLNKAKKLSDMLLKLKRRNLDVPVIIDTCLMTIMKYYEDYQFIKDPVLEAALSKRQKNEKTQYLRALAKILKNESIALNENIILFSFTLARIVLEFNQIYIELNEYRKTLVKYYS